MNSIVVSTSNLSPEEGRRQWLHVHLGQDGGNPSQLLDLLAVIVENEDWKRLRDEKGGDLTFRDYIVRPFPIGIGWTIPEVEMAIKHKHRHEVGATRSAAVVEKMRRMRQKVMDQLNPKLRAVGPPEGSRNNPLGPAGATVSPAASSNGSSRTIRSGSEPRGTVVAYTISRLKRDRPDLAEKVIEGEISANAAAIQAGFRKPSITLPVDPAAAVRLIVKHFRGEALDALIRGLANWRGFGLTEPDEQPT